MATALAVEDAAAEDVVDTLFAASLIEEAAKEEAENVVQMSLDVRAPRRRPRTPWPRPTKIEAAAALRAVRALIAADLIEREAAQEAINALVAAQMIEQEAADEALESVLAAEAVGAGVS